MKSLRDKSFKIQNKRVVNKKLDFRSRKKKFRLRKLMNISSFYRAKKHFFTWAKQPLPGVIVRALERGYRGVHSK